MIKNFCIKNDALGPNLFPNYYLFKQKIEKFSLRKDIISFNLGDKEFWMCSRMGSMQVKNLLMKGLFSLRILQLKGIILVSLMASIFQKRKMIYLKDPS